MLFIHFITFSASFGENDWSSNHTHRVWGSQVVLKVDSSHLSLTAPHPPEFRRNLVADDSDGLLKQKTNAS